MSSTEVHLAAARAQLAADREQLRTLQLRLHASFSVIDRGQQAYLESLELLGRLAPAQGSANRAQQ